jgi:hypothetical protein
VRLDGTWEDPAADRLGTFTYLTLDDVAAGRPASFTRTLHVATSSAQVWNGFTSLSDTWRVSPALQLLYGARVEGNAYVTHPGSNPALQQALGVRNDQVPSRVALSPRLGFTWRRTSQADGYTMGRFGSFRIPGTSVLRGGVGEFRSLLGPDLVGAAAAATGLPSSTQQLRCTGSAVPTSAWSAWAGGTAPPTACATGVPTVGADPFSNASPDVVAIDPDYTAPRSWRANLAWSGVMRGKMAYQVEGIYSLNLNQPASVDANFTGAPRFSLAGEGRPVYVDPASVVPATGALGIAASRRSSEFGRVMLQRSDVRSTSRQLALTLSPTAANLRRWWASGSYVLGAVRQQAYGFDGTTFGDPRHRDWARGDLDVRHQFLVQAGVAASAVTLSLFGRIASGTPYTPLVGSDINGDGLINDRAFVFDPASPSTDPSMATPMRQLLASVPSAARSCLAASLGRAAGRNACEGPWTAAINARIAVDGSALRLGERAQVGLNLSNPLAGLDQLLHGSRLRGWGTPAAPDPVLLRVRGFDPEVQRFRYAVNPNFGATRLGTTPLRVPFRVTLDVSIDLAQPLPVQQLDKWLKPGRSGHAGPRLSAEDIRKRYARNTPDPYRAILQQTDSLLLTRAQVEALQAARVALLSKTDATWSGLAEYLAALGDDYDLRTTIQRQTRVADAVYEAIRIDVQAALPKILTPIQLRLLPTLAADFYDAKGPRKRNYFFM